MDLMPHISWSSANPASLLSTFALFQTIHSTEGFSKLPLPQAFVKAKTQSILHFWLPCLILDHDTLNFPASSATQDLLKDF